MTVPTVPDEAILPEYNVLCGSEYGSKQSGTGKASTPLAPGGLSFAATPIYARVTAHVSKEAGGLRASAIEAIDQGDTPLYSILAPPLHTLEKGIDTGHSAHASHFEQQQDYSQSQY